MVAPTVVGGGGRGGGQNAEHLCGGAGVREDRPAWSLSLLEEHPFTLKVVSVLTARPLQLGGPDSPAEGLRLACREPETSGVGLRPGGQVGACLYLR